MRLTDNPAQRRSGSCGSKVPSTALLRMVAATVLVAGVGLSAGAQRTTLAEPAAAPLADGQAVQSAPISPTPILPTPSLPTANEATVHHIRTSTLYGDGSSEVRHGSGFVVGRHFITVFHNIDVLYNHGSWERTIELGGVVVEPAIVDAVNDIAIFDVPDALCEQWCNDRDPSLIHPGLAEAQPIGWYEFVSPDDARQWRQARIIEVMFKNYRGTAASTVCDSDVVIAVDQPFYPGSSGGPVWDLASNQLLGMVQGSFVRESGQQMGYYKPFSCVQSLLTGVHGPKSVELAIGESL